jgi:hypothetical protein
VSEPGQSIEDEKALQQQRFENLFGVSEADLRDQGIDPDRYARDHIHEALNDRGKWNGILPPSNQYAILWTKWGFRAFVTMFIGIGFLALSNVSDLHWIGIGLACVACVAAASMVVTSIVLRARYVRACKVEGITPSWKRGAT